MLTMAVSAVLQTERYWFFHTSEPQWVRTGFLM